MTLDDVWMTLDDILRTLRTSLKMLRRLDDFLDYAWMTDDVG